MTVSPKIHLSSVLNSALFHAAVKARVPWSRDQPVDFSAVLRGHPDKSKKLDAICYPALKMLSTLGVDNVPDLMLFLPVPESKEFPEQALGLVILLDQGPRALFEGVDSRYVNGYFDILALKLSNQLLALPPALRPDSKQRWMAELGYDFDHWILSRFWFIAPFTHSEQLENHEVQRILVEESRVEVEKLTGKIDPYRASRDEYIKDVTAFMRTACEGPPPDPHMEDLVFWFLMLFDVHFPIIKTFGRYPYRNSVLGRDSSEEEKDFLSRTNHFAEEEDETIVKKIREDVLAGKWTPLSEK
ncbi:hypothetical protein MMC14_005840 [Varicellaria rhodocarpa]|nr:hypothetical protein [Varicellaria rhodocarpa]